MNKKKMNAVVTLGTGGYEQLSYQEVDVPKISSGEVLIKVFAAGVNNTEINTRLGWYSSSFTASTNETQENQEGELLKVIAIPNTIITQRRAEAPYFGNNRG